ncbi:hypothetical protein sS8_4372 [Methylocaldum marinum]|uniref:Auto-transporter adhesin head GIN domain-containing protein n=1 Tax=Methylocaldum marinum TaxID=1432792 RepID=A0A250KXH5_9GAMM|nr:hypothetical protein [Methylocaldum marinum]BBA36302.1 hypothetical protein sS8_4372 [Methylocaldum marinum]
MRLHGLAGFFVAAALAAFGSGCTEKSLGGASGADDVATVKISGARRDVSASHARLFDLYVSGDGNTVRVPSGSAIRTLWVSGVNHRITVAAGASVQSIQLSGVGTSIDLPENVHVAVSSSGVGSRIIKNSDGTDLDE